jgi:hypothetical protein
MLAKPAEKTSLVSVDREDIRGGCQGREIPVHEY